MLGKHLEAVETLISTMQEEPNAVLAENLRGLARAWDIIEATEEDLRSVPALRFRNSTRVALTGKQLGRMRFLQNDLPEPQGKVARPRLQTNFQTIQMMMRST